MSRIHSEILRGLVALGMVGAAAGCTSNEVVFEPRSVDPIFTSYVAIGNSITAGFQSDGINDSREQRVFVRAPSRARHSGRRELLGIVGDHLGRCPGNPGPSFFRPLYVGRLTVGCRFVQCSRVAAAADARNSKACATAVL